MKRKFCLIAGAISAFSCIAQEQGATNLSSPARLTDRFGTITLAVPSKWHDETEKRLEENRAAAKFRGDSDGYTGRDLLLEIKKDEDKRPRGSAGCVFISWWLPPQYPVTPETTKTLVERVANDMHESYRKAQIADFLKRGLSVSALHSTPQRVDLEKSQELQIDGRKGWVQIWKVWHERARDPLISISAAVLFNAPHGEKERKALIVQCTFAGEESRTFWGGKNPEARVHDVLNELRINDAQPIAPADAAR